VWLSQDSKSLPLAPKYLPDQMEDTEKQLRYTRATWWNAANLHKLELIMDVIVDFLWDKMRGWW
jgi:hypothetical protein